MWAGVWEMSREKSKMNVTASCQTAGVPCVSSGFFAVTELCWDFDPVCWSLHGSTFSDLFSFQIQAFLIKNKVIILRLACTVRSVHSRGVWFADTLTVWCNFPSWPVFRCLFWGAFRSGLHCWTLRELEVPLTRLEQRCEFGAGSPREMHPAWL